jgi:myo-inositol-hexaphosphate 3-phosphohydrolase
LKILQVPAHSDAAHASACEHHEDAAQFPFGLFVNQNGKAPEPESTDEVHGYEYDGSTRFELLGWEQIAAELGLVIDLD